MNEFQAILVEIIFFVLRFAIPLLIVFVIARLVHRHAQKEKTSETPEPPETKIAH